MPQDAVNSGVNLLQQIHDAIIVTDLAGKITGWNRSAEALYGYARKEVLGRGLDVIFFPDSPARLKAILFPLTRQKGTHEVELRARTRNGRFIEVHVRVSLLRSPTGKKVGFAACSNDITRQKTAHEDLRRAHADLSKQLEERTIALKASCSELRKSEHNRRLVLSNSPGVVYACNARPPYETTFVSDNVARLFGYTPAAFLTGAELWISHIHPDDRKNVQEFAPAAIAAGGGTTEYRFARADGRYVWIRDSIAVISDESGHVIGVAGYVIDISDYVAKEQERRKAERLKLAAETLVATQESERRRIARELHDDLLQRVAAFGVDLAALDQDAAVEPKLRRRLRGLRRELVEFSDDLQAIAYELHSGMFQHRGLRSAVEQECRLALRRTGLRCAVDFDPGAQTVPVEVATCIYRILQEALRNIAQHSGASKAAVQVKKTRNGVALRIEDFGKGFDTSTSHGGLGITSMSERVRLLDGSFSIDSTPGQGTRIRVVLPLKRGTSAKATNTAG